MNRSKSFFLFALLFLSISCNIKNPDLRSKINASSGEQHPMSEQAWNRLKLPAPGVAEQNAVPVINYPEENILEIAIGPVSLPAQTKHMLIPVHVTAVPFDVWLHGYSWAVTDSKRNQLETSLLHHFNMIDPNKRELFYPISRRLFAAGRETPSVSLPGIMGMPVKANQPILLSTMFANHSNQEYSDVYFRIWFEYTDEERLIKPVEVYPFTLDAGGPLAPRDFEVPAGQSSTSTSATATINARVVGIGGHMHDYGEKIKVLDASDDALFWQTEPVTQGEGHVTSMPTDFYLLPWKKVIEKDHTYKTVAMYQNPLNKPSPDMGMGTVGGLFIPRSEGDWDEPDRNNQLYQDDLVMTLGAPEFHQWHDVTPDEMRQMIASKSQATNQSQGSGTADDEHQHEHDGTQRQESTASAEQQDDHAHEQEASQEHSSAQTQTYENYDKGIGVAAEFDAFPNLHPMVVHFPVVLLMFAALAQLFGLFKFRKETSWVVLVLLAGGFVSGLLAANVWHPHIDPNAPAEVRMIFDEHVDFANTTLWLSGIALVVKIISMFFLKFITWIEVIVALLLISSAGIVGYTGHIGSQMVYLEEVGVHGQHVEGHSEGTDGHEH